MRGAGIFGLCVAWACVKAGARVELVDPQGIAAGASGGIVGALAPHVPENWNAKKQFQFESLILAQDYWPEIEAISGQASGYLRAGRIQPIASEARDLAQSRSKGAAVLWHGKAAWNLCEDAGGWALDSPSGLFIHDTLSAHIHPRQACTALAAALATRDVRVQADPTQQAGATLWATGAKGLEYLTSQHTRLIGQAIKGQAALLQLDRARLPQLFTDSLHIIPHLDGTVAVGSTTERIYDDPSSTDAQLDSVLERARGAVPELRDAREIARWAGLRPRSRSRAPMLGAWPDRPGHFIANGGFKIGFGMAPKVGQVMADLVLDGRNTIPQGFEVAANL